MARKSTPNSLAVVSIGLFCLFWLLVYQAGAQTLQYWDNNGTGTPTGGTWDTTTSNWASSSALTASTNTFANNNFAIFTAGSSTISALTINVSGTVSCEGIGNGTTSTGTASGAYVTTLTIAGPGSINLPSGAWPFECGNGPAPTTIINASITGPGGIVQHNSGALELLGTNTYSGGTTFTGQQLLWYNNSNSFGTGIFSVTGSGSIEIAAGVSGIVTLTNAFVMNNAGGVFNFASGNTTCSGPWTLMTSPQLKNNGASSSVLTISGPISSTGGNFGLYLQCPNASKIVLSGSNTYTGPTAIGYSTGTSPETVSVSSINSVSSPAQQTSSSLGVPSSVANGTILMGYAGNSATLVYTGPGETSDRVISLIGSTGGATIEMDGTGPLVLTSSFTVPTNGAKTLTLQGSSTATNTIAGVIPNSSSGATTVVKAQTGTWVLTGTNTYTSGTTVSNGNLTVNSIADSGTSAIGVSGTLTLGTNASNTAGVPIFTYIGSSNVTTARSVVLNGSLSSLSCISLSGQTLTLSGVVSGAGTPEVTNGTLILTGNNTYAGRTQVDAGGTFEVGGAGKLGSGSYTHTCTVNGTFIYDSSAAQTNTGNFTGSGAFIQEGTGPVTLSATSALTGPVTIGSGSTLIVSTNNNTVTEVFPSANYAGNFTNNGTFNYGATNAETISGPMTGTGSVTVSGTGALTLGSAAYTGATTIAAGSDLIFSSGNSSPFPGLAGLSIGAGGILDVSQCGTPYVFNNNSYSFTGSASASATISGATSGAINLGSAPMSLTLGGASQPVLSLPQSTLTLSSNVITVNNNTGTPLAAGTYTLIQVGGGTTTGAPNQYVTVTGSGLAAGDYATVQVVSGNVDLVVTQPANSSPTWNGNDYVNLHTWSDSTNWASGVPDAIGDLVFFDNNTGLQTPVMDSSYTVNGLTFASDCSPDILTASGANSLTVGGGVTNNSASLQTLAMPVQLVDLGGPSVPSQWSTSGGNITASGVISDNNIGLAVSGGNTLTLSGSNNYTGGTTINSGTTLSVNTIADAPCSIGPSGTVTLAGGTLAYTGTVTNPATSRLFNGVSGTTTTFDVPTNVTLTLNDRVNGTAAFFITKADTGTLVLAGSATDNFFGMNVNGGVVIMSKTGSANSLGNATVVNSGAELQWADNGNGSQIFNGSTTPVTVASGGLLDLNGQNNSVYSLSLSGTGNSYDNNGGALINSAASTTSTLTVPITLAAPATIGGVGNITLPGVVSGVGNSLTYAGTGKLTLVPQGTYTGGTTVNAGGTLQISTGSTTNSSAGTGPITLNGNAALNLNMTNTEMNNVINGPTNSSITINMGNGNLWLSNAPNGQLTNFSGTINVNVTTTNGGQLVVGTAALTEVINSNAVWQIQTGSVVDFNVFQTNPATVYLYGPPNPSATIGSLRLDASIQSGPVILMGNSQIGNGSSSNASTVSGVISDAGHGYGFSKVGPDPVVLSATNTYTGTTTVNASTLDISATGSIASTNVTVNAGTFEVDNASALVSSVTLNVATNAIVNLNYGGTQAIGNLYVGGVQQPAGVYGASTNNPNNVFTNSGTVTVGSAPLLPFSITSAKIVSGQLTIGWLSTPSGNYNIYSTTNLIPPVIWTLVNSNSIPATGTNTSYTLPGGVSGHLFVKVSQ